MAKSKLLSEWEAARDDLGLDIVAPYDVDVGGNVKLKAEVLVRNFGARNGMLIVTDYTLVKSYLEKLQSLGYGFSVLEEPRGKANAVYNREVFIDMLNDWGWSGAEATKPSWIKQTA